MPPPIAAVHSGDDDNYILDSPSAAYPDQEEFEEAEEEEGVGEDGDEEEEEEEDDEEEPPSSPISADDNQKKEEEACENSSSVPIATDNNQKEIIQRVEFGRLELNSTSCFNQGKAEAGVQTETLAILGSTKYFINPDPPNEQLEAPPNDPLYTPDTFFTLQKDSKSQESGSITGKKSPKLQDEVHHDSNSYPMKTVIRDDEIAKSSSGAVKGPASINQATNAAFHLEGGREQSEDTKDRASSLAANTRPSSLSPHTKFTDGVKQPTVICDFFSKGWCIKGNSCNFLHAKCQKPDQQPEGTEAAAKRNGKLHLDEGLIDSTGKSRSGNLCNQQALSSRNTRINSTSPIVESNFSTVENSHSAILSRSNQSSWTPSSYAAKVDELGPNQSHSQFNNPSLPALSRYPSSATNFSLPANCISHSDRVSDWTRSYFAHGSSSLNVDSPYDKLLNRDGVIQASRSASLLRNSSLCSGSEPQITHSSSAGLKRKFSSYDWEPSKPFRPSFFISMPGMSGPGPGSQYDPIRDSIEQSNAVDGAFKVYSLGDFNLNGMLHPHHNFQDNALDKDGHVHELKLAKEDAEAACSSVNDQHNEKIVLKEEKHVTPTHVMDVTEETNKMKTTFDSRHLCDRSRHRKEQKVDRGRHIDDMVVDQKTDSCFLQDSKALRYFRSTLVEHVKEVLKPTWREGRLSKDAHNLIVKRAVDKVLSTIQSRQLPSTVESVQQYLLLSEVKIAKLVEGYVEKYGKS